MTHQPDKPRTPCSPPNPCENGELCAHHEEEQAHADGEHEYCGVTCEVAMPTELMRNSLIAWAPPGGKGILAELERRAAAEVRTAALSALPQALEAALTERFTALGNPYSEMRTHEQGPDGWPASHPVGPHKVAEVLRELLRDLADGEQPEPPCCSDPTCTCIQINAAGRCDCTRWESPTTARPDDTTGA